MRYRHLPHRRERDVASLAIRRRPIPAALNGEMRSGVYRESDMANLLLWLSLPSHTARGEERSAVSKAAQFENCCTAKTILVPALAQFVGDHTELR